MTFKRNITGWVAKVVQRLKPAFGGIPVFCQDPDGILDQGEVREAFLQAGMQLDYWDGELDTLAKWVSLPDDVELLIVLADGAPRHQVEQQISDHLWLSISASDLFGKFDLDIVQAVPVERWNELFDLHEQESRHATAEHTAELVARALYGLDVHYMTTEEAWVDKLLQVSIDGRALPRRVVRKVLEGVPIQLPIEVDELADALSDPSNARLVSHEWLSLREDLLENLQRSHRVLLDYLRLQVAEQSQSKSAAVDLVDIWKERATTIPGVLKFAIEYGQAQANGGVSEGVQREINELFFEWLREAYSQVLSTNNPDVLRLHSLVDHLVEILGSDKCVFLVVDAMGLHPWTIVESAWQSEGLISAADLKAVFAVLPTVTSLSRRALFEGKLPSQFGSSPHGQQLERKLWQRRFGEFGTYVTVKEPSRIQDAFARSQSRICLVDVDWDKLGHSLDPAYISISEAAKGWARNTPIRRVVADAFSHGYRVFLTADHGQIACKGKGRLSAGVYPEERSKRVAIFDREQLFQQHLEDGVGDFQPMGLPNGRRVLFAPELNSFDLENVTGVSHGGISIDEVCVPFVELHP